MGEAPEEFTTRIWITVATALLALAITTKVTGQECTLVQTSLSPPGVALNNNFGYGCAIDGDTCTAITPRGRCLVYTRAAGVWSIQA